VEVEDTLRSLASNYRRQALFFEGGTFPLLHYSNIPIKEVALQAVRYVYPPKLGCPTQAGASRYLPCPSGAEGGFQNE